jgi:16S rRNA (cytosine967-C5)-methyltransferase
MTPARLAAARVLTRIEQGRTTLSAEIDEARAGLEAPRDRALLLELAAGTLRWRSQLDALIDHGSGRRVATLDPPVRTVLRLGTYQMTHLDRIPPHAVVHESVDVARALGAARAAGFVNAVLRRLTRTDPTAVLPPRPGPDAAPAAQLAYLSTTLSHPEWLVARWLRRHSFEDVERWCLFNNAAPLPAVRPLRMTTDEALAALATAGLDARRGAFVTTAIRLPAGSLGTLPTSLRAEFAVQDEGSQLVALAVGARPGDRVLDVCAAPGGKTLLLQRAVGAAGVVVAGDRRPARLAILRAMLGDGGTPARMLALDGTRALPFGASFDRVLLDAPCSGLGTLSRDPDLKWRRTEDELTRFAAVQRTMLACAAGAVRPGGRLVYATCSSEPDENADVVAEFLRGPRDPAAFSLEPVRLPASVARQDELIDEAGCLRTDPARHGLDAFFTAVLARRRAT